MENKNTKVANASEFHKEIRKTSFVFPSENLKRYQFPTHINDLVIDRADSNFSEVFMVLIKPNQAPPYHKHDDTEQVFFILEGTGKLTIGDQRDQFSVKPGDVIRVPISTLHSIKADDKQTLKYLCVDCFGRRPKDEPTWEDHVKVICNNNNWDFDQVVNQT